MSKTRLSCLINPPRDLEVHDAFRIQSEFRERVIRNSVLPSKPKLIAGLDSAYRGSRAFTAAAALEFPTMKSIEIVNVGSDVLFPYIPGLLGFREAPLLIAAAKKLVTKVDVLVVDGHGYAHPRRFGLACHVGVALDTPVIGVAKSLLIGAIEGSRVVDGDEVIGAALSSRGGRGLYVSVGHKVSLRDAVRIVSKCLLDSSPEPVRVAHIEANRMRRNSP